MTDDLDQLAFQFFKVFAQCEYALKAMGFGRAARGGDAAEADWDRFANDIGVLLLQETQEDVVAVRTYLLTEPPKRQVWIDGVVKWAMVSNNDRSAQMLFGHIRRVRNNLYHGGKFHAEWIAPDRSRELMSKSLLLLEHLAASNEELDHAMRGNALE